MPLYAARPAYVRERTGAILPGVAPSNVYPTRRRRLGPDRRQPRHRLRPAGARRWAGPSWRDPQLATHKARGGAAATSSTSSSRDWTGGLADRRAAQGRCTKPASPPGGSSPPRDMLDRRALRGSRTHVDHAGAPHARRVHPAEPDAAPLRHAGRPALARAPSSVSTPPACSPALLGIGRGRAGRPGASGRWSEVAEATTVEIVEVGPRDGLQNEPSTCSPRPYAPSWSGGSADAGLRRIEVGELRRPAAGAADGRRRGGRRRERPRAGRDAQRRWCSTLAATSGCAHAGCRRGARRAVAVTDDVQPAQPGPRPSSESLARRNRSSPPPVRTGVRVHGHPRPRPSAARSRATSTRRCRSSSPHRRRRCADEVALRRHDRRRRCRAQVRALLARLARRSVSPLGLHLHNTRNTGYANAYAALEHGVERAGRLRRRLGGARSRPHATGNIATEDLALPAGPRGGRHRCRPRPAAGGVAVGHRPARPRPAGSAAPGLPFTHCPCPSGPGRAPAASPARRRGRRACGACRTASCRARRRARPWRARP